MQFLKATEVRIGSMRQEIGNAADADEKDAELLKPTLKKNVFVAFSKAIARAEDLAPSVAEHLAYMNLLESAEKLFVSGPFVQEGFGRRSWSRE
jgi:hypothetical protein